MLRGLLPLLLLAVLFVSGCGERGSEAIAPQYADAKDPSEVYRVAVHPLYNPHMLHTVFDPLMRYLETKLPGRRFELEASRDYAGFEEKLKQRSVVFALPNPYQTLMAQKHGYRVFAKMADDSDFRGVFLVRKDSGIRSVADLKGKQISYPAPTALAATMLPQYYLYSQGLNVERDTSTMYVGSQESSIIAVLRKQVVAGATWPPPWRAFQKSNPQDAAQLELIWQTSSLPNNSFMVRDDVSAEFVARVRDILVKMTDDVAGRAVLEKMQFGGFAAADDASYEPIRQFVEDFNRHVRPIQTHGVGQGLDKD